jgi:hypothetical protein
VTAGKRKGGGGVRRQTRIETVAGEGVAVNNYDP